MRVFLVALGLVALGIVVSCIRSLLAVLSWESEAYEYGMEDLWR